jgi:hypothetical protein
MELPHLVYHGILPIEAGLHGSALLYRLFQDYPPDRLLVLESVYRYSKPELRLPGVRYGLVNPRAKRHRRFGSLLYLTEISQHVRTVSGQFGDFRPEALITLAHGSEWYPAYVVARSLGLPFYMIVHDAGHYVRPLLRHRLFWWVEEVVFRHVYRAARSRFCVSPFMEQDFRRRYGVPGTVMLPTVGGDCPVFDEPPEPVSGRPFRLAYAGSPETYFKEILFAEGCLKKIGGELWIYGALPHERRDLIAAGFPEHRVFPPLPERELVQRLREDADATYLPMPFDEVHQLNMRLSFPSKLTCYTAAGLPVVIRGPKDCSAVCWAQEHPGFARCVTNISEESFLGELSELAVNHQMRRDLALESLRVGAASFRPAVAQKLLYEALEA